MSAYNDNFTNILNVKSPLVLNIIDETSNVSRVGLDR